MRSPVRISGGANRDPSGRIDELREGPTFEKLLAALPAADRLFFEAYSADRGFPIDRAAAACVVFFVRNCLQAMRAEAEKRNGG